MTKRAISIAAALLIMAMVAGGLVGCVWDRVEGSGNLTTESYDFTDFTKLEGQSGFELEVSASSTFSIELTADDNVHQYIEVEKSGETLTLRLRGNRFYDSVTLRAKITLPELHGIELSGGSQADITGFSSTVDFEAGLSGGSQLSGNIACGNAQFELSGGSQVNGYIVCGNAGFDLSGGSQVNLAGVGNDLIIDASGGSQLDLEDFPIDDATINMSGGSQAVINISGTLNADLSGASRIFYVGTPTLGDTEMSGDSGISAK